MPLASCKRSEFRPDILVLQRQLIAALLLSQQVLPVFSKVHFCKRLIAAWAGEKGFPRISVTEVLEAYSRAEQKRKPSFAERRFTMSLEFHYGIEAFMLLVQQWVAAALPEPPETERAKKLGGIWFALGNALCSSDKKQYTAFMAERGHLAVAGRGGYPPIHALEQRLRELEKAGIQEGFLAVALREATEVLIARDLPDALDQWRQLADQLVPKEMRFSYRDDQRGPISRVIYGPDL